jgi:soluble lytic murein transglycosylase
LYAHWPRTALTVSALIIPGLWLLRAVELPDKVADYRAYLKALEQDGLSQYAYVVSELQPVWSTTPPSPLVGRAAVLAARAQTELGQPSEAVAILRKYSAALPKPEGLMLLARALEAAEDAPAAVAAYQRVFYEHPLSVEASEAETALARLRLQLGGDYPPAMPRAMLDRAGILMRGGSRVKARLEYAQIASLVSGEERDLALVRASSGDERRLSALQVRSPAADIERLTLLGNIYVVRNDVSSYESVFRGCSISPYCHWRLTWSRYIRHAPDAATLLGDHVDKFPKSEKRSAALYFLKRYADVVAGYPLSYYAAISKEKLKAQPQSRAVSSAPDFDPSPALRARIERADLLEAAGYPEWAEFELSYAAENEGQPFAAAIALAEISARRGAHEQALRYIKKFARGYLAMPLESAPQRFWRLAFPLPYRESLENYARLHSIDVSILAGLIRQESEFDPKAISRAKAYGLTQVLPSTGRELSRRAGMPSFTSAMLFEPEINLRLGTLYLKSLLNQHGGSWETTLAAYNAGQSRVTRWLTWAEYREPAEFIENIPFTETREYVQAVLRNADIYRRLYGHANR